MNEPKKLIREFIVEHLTQDEWEVIENQDELNQLYALKICEELAEIQASGHKDIMEFVDLLQVVSCFAEQNGFNAFNISEAMFEKKKQKGSFGRLALNNLNPNNPSNSLYFEDTRKQNNKQNIIKPKVSDSLFRWSYSLTITIFAILLKFVNFISNDTLDIFYIIIIFLATHTIANQHLKLRNLTSYTKK